MKSTHFGKRLIVSIILIYYYQHTSDARTIKGSKAKNATVVDTQPNQTKVESGQEGAFNKTTTVAATNKLEMDTTTLSAGFEVDGRHAFINNEFVAEDEEPPTTSTAATSYNRLQDTHDMDYVDPVIPLTKPPAIRPILGIDLSQLDEYEDEGAGDYNSENESLPGNCEDTQESLIDNNYKDFNMQQTILHDVDSPPPYTNRLYDSGDSHSPTNTNSIGLFDSNDFVKDTNNINAGLLYAAKLAQHLYDQTDSNKKHSLHSNPLHDETSLPILSYRNPQNKQQTKEMYDNGEYNLFDKLNYANNTTETLNNLPDNLNTPNASFMPSFSYGNINVPATSTFSTTPSGHNKRFKTVSSSIQYVSTPLADLVFKYSIGMSKHSNRKGVKKSSAKPEIGNYMNGKTE